MRHLLPRERRTQAVFGERLPPRDPHDLRFVMEEIVELMQARAAILTLHASNGSAPALIYADPRLPDPTCKAMIQSFSLHVRAEFEEGQGFWRDLGARNGSMFLMPIEQLSGHSRLVIAALFGRVDAPIKERAERLFRERRPFATGFFQLWQQNRILQQRAQALESVLDQTAIGSIMLDQAGRIIFTNQTAAEILAQGDGIGRANGVLRASNFTDGVSLQAAIGHVNGGDGDRSDRVADKVPLLAFRRKQGPPLVAALLAAQSRPIEPGDVAAVMYLVDPQIDTSNMLAPLCKLYGLSLVETSLACFLAAGDTLSSAAQKMHLKEQTARGYLKTIFIKTATKRQTELVVLMLSSLIRMKRDASAHETLQR